MKISHLLLSFSIFCLAVLPGCVRSPKYTKRPLTKLTKETADYSQTQDNVTVMAKKFTSQECKEMFNTNLKEERKSIYLPEEHKSIETIQFSVENNTSQPVKIDAANITMPLLNTQYITQKLQYSVAAPLAGYGLLGATSIPLAYGGLFPTFVGLFGGSLPLFLTGLGTIVGAAALLITVPTIGIINAVKTAKVNRLIKEDVEAKTLSTLTVQPNETQNTLIFVQTKDLPNEFNLKVAHEADANKITDFAISLHPKMQSDTLTYKG